ncbi:MAG: DMT family transporter [Candidatus Bathyarchaeia archaeon]
MLGIALAVLASVTSAFAVVIVGKNSQKSTAFNISLIVSCVGMAILWPLAGLSADFTMLNFEALALFMLSGLLTPGLVRLCYYAGLKKLGASVNAALFSVYPLYSALFAIALLNETLRLENWSGILFIIAGCFFVELSFNQINGGSRVALGGLLLPVGGGLALAVAAIIRKAALNLYNAPVLGTAVSYAASVIAYSLVLTFFKSTRKQFTIRRDLRFFWKAGIGQAITWVLAFYALSFENVSVVTPILATEPLFIALFAQLFLRGVERLSLKIVAGSLLIVLGVALVII